MVRDALVAVDCGAAGDRTQRLWSVVLGHTADSEEWRGRERRGERAINHPSACFAQGAIRALGKGVHRPDVTAVGEELWLACGHLELQRFDVDLTPLAEGEYGGGSLLRVSQGTGAKLQKTGDLL